MSWPRALGLWGPVALYAGLLGYFSGRAPLPEILASIWDKALHAGAYAALALLAIRGLQGGILRFRLRLALAGAAAAILYGAAVEIRQAFVPGRTASVGDLLANTVGAAVAVAAARWIERAALAGRVGREGRDS